MSGIEEPAGVDDRAYDQVGAREETSLVGFANVVLKYRGMIAVLMIACAVFGAFKFIQARPRYMTRIGVNVSANHAPAEVSGLAAQLGIAHPAASAEEVAFFTELLRSPPLLRQVAKGPYTVVTRKGRITGPLTIFYGFSGRPELHEDEMTDILNSGTSISGSARTGNIWIFVEATYPELAQQVAQNMVGLIDNYSRARKHAQAEAEREFVQGRLAEAKQELRTAEDQALKFRVDNRDFSSPALAMTNLRLLRDVSMKQLLYTSLLQTYDRARIAEARNVTSITILESPERPLKPERSDALSMPLLGAIAGLLLGIVIAFVRERMEETAAAPTPAFDHFRELRRDALRDLKNPLRPFGRVRKPVSDG